MPTITIVPAAELPAAQYADLLALCTRAYEEPFEDTLRLFPDGTHVLAHEGGMLVSHALWVPRILMHNDRSLRCAYVEAVATEPALQGRGHATSVLRALASAIESFEIGGLSPSDPAFYARLGWESWRGPLYAAMPHGSELMPDEEAMVLRLPATPTLDLDGPLAAPWREGDIW